MQLFGQMNPGKPVPSFTTILSNLVKNDGFFSIYKGVDAAVGRQMVYGTARIGLHRKFSDKLVERNEGKAIAFHEKALSGMASGSIAVCIGTPFDIALVRLQSDGMAKLEDRRNYKNVFDVRTRFLPTSNGHTVIGAWAQQIACVLISHGIIRFHPLQFIPIP
jgi:solute carrier family 25 oxoglutarate transporter 11